MKASKNGVLLALLLLTYSSIFSQCADPANIYTFTYNGHTYEVVKENKTWTEASTCAVSRDGYLAEINDEAEQNAIFDELVNNADIDEANTQNQFGTASVWLGGHDAGVEGEWIWDGANDGTGPQFWNGGPNGNPVGGLYTNWGVSPPEPDNSGGQDHLTIIIKATATNFSLWNDLVATNTIYYLIEKDVILGTSDSELKKNIAVYPNPFKEFISIENNTTIAIEKATIFDLKGQKIRTITSLELKDNAINVASLSSGMYILNIHFENGKLVSQKIIK